ncbi:MAG: hypothetical protein A2722_01695 [Candidatus Doudnabacteria bacterium RIFCSPHIGHO2_01_FULL_50_11]|uniref:Uncharacterized protein n=1 Tax=Candidatus Doudnabacteria bacterium RIFCSPHIGHO2_01_FULL_50_11 TaxID=1817828 RepID=A0A1F5PEA6_9BACT|nr:MAG: hypothetical protein A2722_01695 [Candidatus Doudnabacteria bacterium RIFCSPHIGHO2_01_FULL_50_11]HLC44321.1 hypothetical protein [Patescibacteria group bacterium]
MNSTLGVQAEKFRHLLRLAYDDTAVFPTDSEMQSSDFEEIHTPLCIERIRVVKFQWVGESHARIDFVGTYNGAPAFGRFDTLYRIVALVVQSTPFV